MVPTSTHGAIVVTGASRGIGAAIAAALVEEGVNVACLSRSGAMPDLPEGAHEDLRRRFHPIACDIADEAGFAEALRQTSDRFGDIARAGQQRGRA
ncbi:SDR family NAD(P)-dependent oxidoreductase [Mameliella alba]|uniref:SDR family NAD(P)-dependent oxidoreductase n=1 Tax=Mameliella alba TaxID=561184 RepID=UPI0012FF68CF|nr:SDR family NAD(P)-dependent oxidoreductase [Mameliella alba]MBY6121102.1 SDR family oxidoreductase [Mameliella alba]